VRRHDAAVRQQFSGVLEDDDAVAQQAPALLGVAGDDAGGVVVGGVRGRTGGKVHAVHWDLSDLSGMGVTKVTCDQRQTLLLRTLQVRQRDAVTT